MDGPQNKRMQLTRSAMVHVARPSLLISVFGRRSSETRRQHARGIAGSALPPYGGRATANLLLGDGLTSYGEGWTATTGSGRCSVDKSDGPTERGL